MTNHCYHYSHHVYVSLSSFYGTIIEVSTLTENIIVIVVIIVVILVVLCEVSLNSQQPSRLGQTS